MLLKALYELGGKAHLNLGTIEVEHLTLKQSIFQMVHLAYLLAH
jgi:hypothetical protein